MTIQQGIVQELGICSGDLSVMLWVFYSLTFHCGFKPRNFHTFAIYPWQDAAGELDTNGWVMAWRFGTASNNEEHM